LPKTTLPALIVLALLGLYIANCFTPLRLTNDTVRYFNIKEWLEAGRPQGHGAANEFLPYGYVWFLMALEKLHLANPFFIAFIQLLYLLGAVLFIRKLFGEVVPRWQLLALCLLSWASLKFVITPLSEMQFLFFSMGALHFFRQWQQAKKPLHLLWAVMFTAVAIVTRTIGIVLVATFILSFLLKNRLAIKNIILRNKPIVGAALGVLVICFFAFNQFGITAYLRNHSAYFKPFLQYPFGFIKNNLENHLMNWSALVLNAPAPRVSFISYGLLKLIYLAAGVLSVSAIGYFLSRKHANLPQEARVYLVCYALLLFNWPLFEPRLWLPVFPLCIAVLLQQEKTLKGFARYAARSYKALYILVGIAAMGYYSYTSFNKKALAAKQDTGIWRNEYETHFFGATLSDTATVVREPVVKLLQKHDR
jgi:hypothetical protein